jgi:hypothetical protein
MSPDRGLNRHRASVSAVFLWALMIKMGGLALADPTPPPPPPPPSAIPSAAPSPSGSMKASSGLDLYDGRWHATLVPYLWAPNINGTLKFGVPRLPNQGAGLALVDFKIGPNDYLASLNFAIMATVEVRKGNLALLGDYINLNVSSSTGSVTSISGPLGHIVIPLSLSTSERLSGTMWLLAPSYTVLRGSAGSVDFLVGARGLGTTASANWNFTAGSNDFISRSGSVSKGVSIDDFVVGVRGRVNLGTRRWFVPYYIDAGWGSNNSTWRGQIGIALAANHGQSIILGYRTLQYNMTNLNVLQSVRFSGPGLGYSFQL